MSVIANLSLPADSFELGRILSVEYGTTIVLENMVPLGEKAVPLITVYDSHRDAFERSVREHSAVQDIRVVSTHGDETLYALDWVPSEDAFIRAVKEAEGYLLNAEGTVDGWAFELRFPTHADLSTFQQRCSDAGIPIELGRIYNPTRPESGRWYGLTGTQRETLLRAVQDGYYSIPRQISTQELADEFGVSDQAVTERLRRAIIALVENTLITAAEYDESVAPDQ